MIVNILNVSDKFILFAAALNVNWTEGRMLWPLE